MSELMNPEAWTKEDARRHFEEKTKELGLKHTFSFDEAYDYCMEKRNRESFRNNVMDFQKKVESMPNALGKNPFPLKHEFADGMYIRTLTVPARVLTVTMIHGKDHPVFLQKGTISVLTEKGIQKHTAPFSMITKAGTKRVIFHHDEVVITTVHRTDEKDLEKIEAEIIAKDFKDVECNLGNAEIEGFLEQMSKEGE